jgi:predicted aspartyl protease
VCYALPLVSKGIGFSRRVPAFVCLAAFVFGAIAPSLSAATAGAPQYEALPLIHSAQNHLLVQAEINGKPATLVVDSGAPVSAVSLDRAEHYGLTPVKPKSKTKLPHHLNINGAFNPVSIARSLRIGFLSLIDEPMILIKVSEGRGARRESDGILGTDVLSPLKAILDYDKMLLVLKIDPSVPGSVSGYDFRGFRRIRMQESDGGNLFVPGSINGTKARLMVDTGAPGTLLHSQFIVRMKIPTEKSRFNSIGVNVPESRVHLANINNLSIGSMDMQSSRVGVINLQGLIHDGLNDSPPVVGLLGSQMLHDYHAIIDFGTKSLYLKR